MSKIFRIGTRDSELAVWQATLVQQLFSQFGFKSELVFIKSEGDINLITPLYEMGVQGIFTKTLDAALLSKKIDVAVHSMKDVPVQLAKGIMQAAVLKRASYKDILVYKNDTSFLQNENTYAVIATSSVRRKAQWLNHYPNHQIENLRGNVNTRLQKLNNNNWHGAIFAAAGLERINLRPPNSLELNWMLPAPAQGAIMVVCNDNDYEVKEACMHFNDEQTALCTKAERDFLKALLGGCSTPISALAEIENNKLVLKGNICSPNGKNFTDVKCICPLSDAHTIGVSAAKIILNNGGKEIITALNTK